MTLDVTTKRCAKVLPVSDTHDHFSESLNNPRATPCVNDACLLINKSYILTLKVYCFCIFLGLVIFEK